MNGQKFHVYECVDCIVTFAVEEAFEDHSVVKCPVCGSDEAIGDVAYGEMTIIQGGESCGSQNVGVHGRTG